MSIMEKNIYLIDSRSTEQQAVIGNFVKTTILNDIVKKTYSLWNNLKTVCLNSGTKVVSLNSYAKKVGLNSYAKKLSLNSYAKKVGLNSYAKKVKVVSLNSGMKMVCRPIEWLCSYYSNVLERKLTMRQTWLLINAQLAFGAAFFPVEAPWVVRIGCLAWVVSALLKCKRGLK